MKKTIIKATEQLDDSFFEQLKSYSKDIITFSYLTENEIDKKTYIEKVCDYLEAFCAKNGTEVKDLSSLYTSTLMSELSLKPGKKTREEAYLLALKQRIKEMKKEEKANIDRLEDCTRIFVSFYNLQMTKKGEFDFCLSMDFLKKTIKGLKDGKTYKNLIAKGKKTSDISVKYSKLVFSMFLMELLYLHMLNNAPKSELGENNG